MRESSSETDDPTSFCRVFIWRVAGVGRKRGKDEGVKERRESGR